MKYIEEDHARNLFKSLSDHFASEKQATDLSVKGMGVHWDCIAQRGPRHCCIHCFALPRAGGPEYLASFEEGGERIAMGRTSSDAEIIQATGDWLRVVSLQELHSKFGFVDRQKRDLLEISRLVASSFPGLQDAAQLHHSMCDLYDLVFAVGDRSCKVACWGKNQFPDAFFEWDQCQLFRFPMESIETFAWVLNDWLYRHAMPSAIRREFPWIQMGDLAGYYEAGRPIEGEFIESWKGIREFYSQMEQEYFPVKDDVLQFIDELRERGYDKVFRAGQSMFTMMLSRSRRHGLRDEQPCIAFNFSHDGVTVRSYFDGGTSFKIPAIAVTPELDELLKQLSRFDVN